MRFQARPIVVEAMQFKTKEDGEKILHWAEDHHISLNLYWAKSIRMIIEDLEGQEILVMPTDWVIKDHRGDLRQMSDVEFQLLYVSSI